MAGTLIFHKAYVTIVGRTAQLRKRESSRAVNKKSRKNLARIYRRSANW